MQFKGKLKGLTVTHRRNRYFGAEEHAPLREHWNEVIV